MSLMRQLRLWLQLVLLLLLLLQSATVSCEDSRPAVEVYIVGCNGDLAQRYLWPAFFQLARNDSHGASVSLNCVIRGDSLPLLNGSDSSEVADWFGRNVRVHAGVRDDGGYRRMCEEAAGGGGRVRRVFYLSIPPSAYVGVVRAVQAACPAAGNEFVLEKPFGSSRESALRLAQELRLANVSEAAVHRVDHYLGKFALAKFAQFRRANPHLDSLLSSAHVTGIEAAIWETLGVEDRLSFYDAEGVIRDVMQNHLTEMLLQVLADLPPPSHGGGGGDWLEREKARLLAAFCPPIGSRRLLIGQYAGYGSSGGAAPLLPRSQTATFAAAGLTLCRSGRWAGVPIVASAGKRLALKASYVRVTFRRLPRDVASNAPGGDEADAEEELLIYVGGSSEATALPQPLIACSAGLRCRPSESLRPLLLPGHASDSDGSKKERKQKKLNKEHAEVDKVHPRRVGKEDKRVNKKKKRVDKEDKRVDKEDKRVDKEDKRVDKEDKQVDKEDKRVDKEDKRVDKEDKRVGKKDKRVGKKDKRVGKEDKLLNKKAKHAYKEAGKTQWDEGKKDDQEAESRLRRGCSKDNVVSPLLRCRLGHYRFFGDPDTASAQRENAYAEVARQLTATANASSGAAAASGSCFVGLPSLLASWRLWDSVLEAADESALEDDGLLIYPPGWLPRIAADRLGRLSLPGDSSTATTTSQAHPFPATLRLSGANFLAHRGRPLALAAQLAARIGGKIKAKPPGEAFHLALPGGESAARLMQLLAAPGEAWSDAIAASLHVWLTDERCVLDGPQTDGRHLNSAVVDENFLRLLPVPLPHRRLHFPPRPHSAVAKGDAVTPDSCAVAAAAYAAEVDRWLGEGREFDFVVLGVGADGHVASLFSPSDLEIDKSDDFPRAGSQSGSATSDESPRSASQSESAASDESPRSASQSESATSDESPRSASQSESAASDVPPRAVPSVSQSARATLAPESAAPRLRVSLSANRIAAAREVAFLLVGVAKQAAADALSSELSKPSENSSGAAVFLQLLSRAGNGRGRLWIDSRLKVAGI